MLHILRIEIDGHFHGGKPIQPWVAEITGPDLQYGLARKFIDRMTDWKDASRACSGNIYGRIATFPLREGRLYEALRARGNPSKRHTVREFYSVGPKGRKAVDYHEAIAIADADERAYMPFVLAETSAPTKVARVRGLGTPAAKAFVVVDGKRYYHMHEGDLYEVVGTTMKGQTRGPFVVVRDGVAFDIDEREAFACLTR